MAENNEQEDNNIKIFLRIKPSKKPSGYFQWEDDDKMLECNVPKDVAGGLINNSKTNYKFKFDSVLEMDATQEDVFDVVGKPCVRNALAGFNSTIFAYGQTGSGKTFTITGGAERYVDRGLIPRSLSMIYKEMKERSDMQIDCYISYMEIYMERGYDLLDQDRSEKQALSDLPRVTMLEDEDGNCHLRNLSMHRANTEEEALNFLFIGDTNRAVSETAMNLASSRSHCIFTVSIESRKAGSEVILRSKLHMVDLAGSERAHKTGAQGKVLREAGYINTSLHYLEMVIVALHEKSTKGRGHIPYRNSMMTSVLRDSLGGNCKTAMIATVSAEGAQTDESISTCRFAQRVARVRNDAHLNEELDPSIVIKRLKGEVATLKEEIAMLKGEAAEGDELSERDLKKLREKCEEYVNDADPAARLVIGELTYTRIRACFNFLKQIAQEASKNAGSASATPASDNGQVSSDRVRELEQTITQRNNEIAILIKMVKEGKGKGDVPNNMLDEMEAGMKAPIPAVQKPTPKQPAPTPMTFNIQIDDPKILDDPKKAFEVFSKQYPKAQAINDNKKILQEKYHEAKATADIVNKARKIISKQKKLIAEIRQSQALEEVVGQSDERDGDVKGEGKTSSLEETPEEKQAKIIMNQAKAEYKEKYSTLSSLKSEIEQIQKMLERSRKKLQLDFDQWYDHKLGKGEALTQSLVSNNPPASSIKKAWPSPKHKSPVAPQKTSFADTDQDIQDFFKASEALRQRNARK